MKKLYTIAAALLLIFNFQLSVINCSAQTPQGMNYQAVARDAGGNILASTNICVQSTITDGSGGPTLYQETFNITTNQFGLFTLNIGNGTPVTGTFAAINWSGVTPWQQMEIKIGCTGSYVLMGTSQLLSVPYALYSASGGTTYTQGTGIDLTGNVITNTAPDQTVVLTGTGATTVTGTYPNFTINSTDSNTTYTAGTGIDLTGNVITNTSPDQTVILTGTGATTVTGTYPNFTVNSTDSNTTYIAGAGIDITGNTVSIPNGAVTNGMLANSSLTVTAGTGLSGGGAVSLGGTTTLDLANTAVTPGTYGSATQTTQFTVDAQGRLTAASNVAIASGVSSASTTSNDNAPVLIGGCSATTNFAAQGVPLAIPDNTPAGVNATFNVTGIVGTPCKVTLTIVDLQHTFDGDLIFTLTNPSSTSAIVINREGSLGDNFTNTVLDDNASTTIAAGVAPFTGSFIPDNPLAPLATGSPNGTWTLNISDNAAIDVGTLNSATLTIYTTASTTYTFVGEVQVSLNGTETSVVSAVYSDQNSVANDVSARLTRDVVSGAGSTGTVIGYGAVSPAAANKFVTTAVEERETGLSAGTYYYKLWAVSSPVASTENYSLIVTKH